MVGYTKRKIARLLKIDFIRFCIVGGMGFTINLIFLTFFHTVLKLPVFFSQLIAAEIALFSNFMLHHNWTYKHHKVSKTKHSLIVQFHLTSWPAIVGSAAMVSIIVSLLNVESQIALVISSLIALLWNFFWSKFVVWRDVSDKEIQKEIK